MAGWSELNSSAGRPSGEGEAGGGEPLRGGEPGQVGPHLEGERTRVDPPAISAPVNPAHPRGVPRTAEPPLVAAEDLALHRGRVDDLRRRGLGRDRAGPSRDEQQQARQDPPGPAAGFADSGVLKGSRGWYDLGAAFAASRSDDAVGPVDRPGPGRERGRRLATYRILCCDGGGIRGLLTALIIRRLHAETGFLGRVDLCAGTSTGGLIALGLAGGLGIDPIVDLYQRRAGEIFRRPQDLGGAAGQFVRDRVKEFAKRIPNVKEELIDSVITYQNEMWNAKYANDGLRKIVSGLFPTDPTLAALPGKPEALVATFQLHDEASRCWRPMALHSLPTPGNDPNGSHVVESVMCTTAAPTFFPPYRHVRLGYCIDGGVFANNPASLALATALEAGVPRESIRLLSIGTGGTRSSMNIPHFPLFQDANAYGIMGWLFPVRSGDTPDYPLLNILFDAGVSTSELLANQVLGSSFRRVQVPLKSSIGFDDVEAIGPLKDAAEGYFRSEAWPGVREWVGRAFA